MAGDLSTRDAKLIQYLNEAYGKEKELETALQAHIKMAKRPPYKKRLQEHLKETKAQAKGLERRIKQLGGKAERASLPGPGALAEAATAVSPVAASPTTGALIGPASALPPSCLMRRCTSRACPFVSLRCSCRRFLYGAFVVMAMWA